MRWLRHGENVSPHHHRDTVLAADPRTHRPNWSAFHPRAPPHTLAGTRNSGTDPRRGRGPATPGPRGPTVQLLLRKEVIQPHLPVRLPCYDFVPIASPTFDHSPPDGLGHGLRVLPTFVT